MQNVLWIIEQLQNPVFVLCVVFPPLLALAMWPVINNYLLERSERAKRRA